MKLNQQIRKYREALGLSQDLSQDRLAEMLYVTRQSVSKWESGDVIPDLEKIIKMTKIFNVSLDNLVLGKETNNTISEVDTSEFIYDPRKDKYIRKLGKMNFWDFLHRDWWIILVLVWFIVRCFHNW